MLAPDNVESLLCQVELSLAELGDVPLQPGALRAIVNPQVRITFAEDTCRVLEEYSALVALPASRAQTADAARTALRALVQIWQTTESTSTRPDFEGFAKALRAEARWSSEIHPNDSDPKRGGTGQAASDQKTLAELAEHVESVGKALGFI